MHGRGTAKWLPDGSVTRFRKFLQRAKPLYLAVGFMVTAASLDYWLAREHTAPVDIVTVSLLLGLGTIVFELAHEYSLLREMLAKEAPFALCWDETETLDVLKRIYPLATRRCRVRAVWGALAFSEEFETFVKGQLEDLAAKKYVVERWIDVRKVGPEPLTKHITEAFAAMKAGGYVLHLVPEAPFGALVVPRAAAAINFQAHRNRPEVIGIYGSDETLAERISTMIDELGEGLELPGAHASTARLEDLLARTEEYCQNHCGALGDE
jgi:hypothetical protein